ncbi:MAG: tRNA 2-thiouridine(34) synthase MnmA [Pseudomonadota bacterium]|nr:tRNA 2-thiouridine(34) synthase MnmA [Pseudomonadota bacterium]
MSEKIAVGFSGGVDSVVAALLLRQEGYEVQLVSLDMGAIAPDLFRQRVMLAANALSLPVEIITVRELFKQQVIDYLTESYLDGVTPNPCIRCNARVKFALLWQAAETLNARWLATGHYVRLASWGNFQPVISQGEDETKDQSYFLQQVPGEWLAATKFPLGKLKKEKVLDLARQAGYPLDGYRESQELCFVKNGSYADLCCPVSTDNLSATGNIVNLAGEIIGMHRGIHHYTLGQRRGLGIAHAEPLYVYAIEQMKNQLVVAERHHLYRTTFMVQKLNWFIKAEKCPRRLLCQIRYRHQPAPASVEMIAYDTIRVVYDQPQFAVTPGQGAAFYRDGCLLVGGVISR